MAMKALALLVSLNFLAAGEIPPVTWASGDTQIVLLERKQDGWVDYSFEVRPANGQPERRRLKSKGLTLEKAWIGPGGKLLVLGRSGTQAAHILIGEPGREGNDWIRTWRNELSPSGRYYALERFVSAHAEVPDVVTIYDLGKPAADNSLSDEPIPDHFGPRDCIGRVVYPESNAFRKTCRIDTLDFRRQLVSPFLWRIDNQKETLFLLVLEGNDLFLIRTKLPADGSPVVLWRQQVDLRGLYHPEPNNDLNFKNGVKFWVDKLSWTPEGKIKVELDPVYGFGSSFELNPD